MRVSEVAMRLPFDEATVANLTDELAISGHNLSSRDCNAWISGELPALVRAPVAIRLQVLGSQCDLPVWIEDHKVGI